MIKKILLLMTLLAVIELVSAGGTIYQLDDLDSLDYQVARLRINDGIAIPYKDKEAIVTFESIKNENINLGFYLLSKKELAMSFKIGNSITLDIDKDGIKDVKVIIENIDGESAELRVEGINILENTPTGNVIDNKNNDDISKGSTKILVGIIVMISIILLGLFIYNVGFKKIDLKKSNK